MGINDAVEAAMLYCDILRYEFIFYKPCQDFIEQVEKSVARLCKLGVVSKVGDNLSLNFKASETLLSALAPFTLAYLGVVESLRKLIGEGPMLETQFIKTCLAHTHDQVVKGEITFGESISTDSIKNCLKLLEKWMVITSTGASYTKKISLSPNFDSHDELEEIIENIERFVILK